MQCWASNPGLLPVHRRFQPPILLLLLMMMMMMTTVNPARNKNSGSRTYLVPWHTVDLLEDVRGPKMSTHTSSLPSCQSPRSSSCYRFKGNTRWVEVNKQDVGRLKTVMSGGEVTILASLKQKKQNRGTIISFGTNRHRFLELESNGRTGELRLHYTSQSQHVMPSSPQSSHVVTSKFTPKSHIQSFSYYLADGNWHQVALTITSDHVAHLYVDCQLISRESLNDVSWDFLNLTQLQVWVGQRNVKRANFKGDMEYVKLAASAEGHQYQCPRSPIVNDCSAATSQYERQVSILNDEIESLKRRLADLESSASQPCKMAPDPETSEHSLASACQHNGKVYKHGESWVKNPCTNCTCIYDEPQCRSAMCPILDCKSTPVIPEGQCCPICPKNCRLHGKVFHDGEVNNYFRCHKHICKNASMRFDDLTCSDADAPHMSSEKREELASCFVRLKCPDFVESEDETEKQRESCSRCHAHATCHPHTHECTCTSGYHGDGINYCHDLDECSSGEHRCHSLSVCINTEGSYTCVCKDGYHNPDPTVNNTHGRLCQDINECSSRGGRHGHHCYKGTVCENKPGGYDCECRPGHRRPSDSADTCQDIDECLIGVHSCHRHARCSNTQGSYKCHCKAGYLGDGTHCTRRVCPFGYQGKNCTEDENECDGKHSCHENSECVNTMGSYTCHCKPGYYSNELDNHHGSLCTDINECLREDVGHNCSAGQTCHNTIGSYRCECDNPSTCDTRGCKVNGVQYNHGQKWLATDQSCTYCGCQRGIVDCNIPVECDCDHGDFNPDCCPRCSRMNDCMFSETSGTRNYRHGDRWHHGCQLCLCEHGRVSCMSVKCPSCMDSTTPVTLNVSTRSPVLGDIDMEECCPRCSQHHCDDPTPKTDNLYPRSCHHDNQEYPHGRTWSMGSCQMCQCEYGETCCWTMAGCEKDKHETNRRHVSAGTASQRDTEQDPHSVPRNRHDDGG